MITLNGITFGDGAHDAMVRTIDGMRGWTVKVTRSDGETFEGMVRNAQDEDNDLLLSGTDDDGKPTGETHIINWEDVEEIHVY